MLKGIRNEKKKSTLILVGDQTRDPWTKKWMSRVKGLANRINVQIRKHTPQTLEPGQSMWIDGKTVSLKHLEQVRSHSKENIFYILPQYDLNQVRMTFKAGANDCITRQSDIEAEFHKIQNYLIQEEREGRDNTD